MKNWVKFNIYLLIKQEPLPVIEWSLNYVFVDYKHMETCNLF